MQQCEWLFVFLEEHVSTSVLQAVLVTSQIQFKVLIFTFKALQGMGLSYLRDHLSPITSTHPTKSTREDPIN